MRLPRYLTPRFTLRAMLVAMALIAVWCTYHLNWIRQRRQEFSASVSMVPIAGQYLTIKPCFQINAKGRDKNKLPLALKLFGERAYARVMVHWEDDDTWIPERDRLESIFPEAIIYRDIGTKDQVLALPNDFEL